MYRHGGQRHPAAVSAQGAEPFCGAEVTPGVLFQDKKHACLGSPPVPPPPARVAFRLPKRKWWALVFPLRGRRGRGRPPNKHKPGGSRWNALVPRRDSLLAGEGWPVPSRKHVGGCGRFRPRRGRHRSAKARSPRLATWRPRSRPFAFTRGCTAAQPSQCGRESGLSPVARPRPRSRRWTAGPREGLHEQGRRGTCALTGPESLRGSSVVRGPDFALKGETPNGQGRAWSPRLQA